MRSFCGTHLTTTEHTTIMQCEESISVDWDAVNLSEIASTPTASTTTLCCPDIVNVKVNIYPMCTNSNCKVKVAPEPGKQTVSCLKCNRSMLLKRFPSGFNCEIQVEKDSKDYDVTVFAKTLGNFLMKTFSLSMQDSQSNLKLTS